jgi:hypothetical protein
MHDTPVALSEMIRVIDSSFKGKNYGRPWYEPEKQRLVELFQKTNDLAELSRWMERPIAGVIPKLLELGVAIETHSPNGFRYLKRIQPKVVCKLIEDTTPLMPPPDPQPYNTLPWTQHRKVHVVDDFEVHMNIGGVNCRCIPEPFITGETEMTHKTIEVVTLINGTRAEQKTDLEIFMMIKQMEKSVADFEEIKNRPAKLNKKIELIKADIAALVKYVDEREVEND